MGEIIEEAYQAIIRLYTSFVSFILVIIILITSPIWVIPYAIYRNKKEDPENE